MAQPTHVQFALDGEENERHKTKRVSLGMTLREYWLGAAEKVYFGESK